MAGADGAPEAGPAMTEADLIRIAAERKQLWENGYPPVALLSHDAGGKDAGKKPLKREWTIEARKQPPEDARYGKALAIAANTGIATHGLRFFDFDVSDPGRAQQLEDLFDRIVGEAPKRRRANSARFGALCRAADGEPRKRTLKGTTISDGEEQPDKIEVLGNGQQFVAVGIHASGAEIFWNVSPLEIHRDQLPVVTEAKVTAFLGEAAKMIGGKVAAPQRANGHAAATQDLPADLARACAVLMEVVPSDDREEWITVGAALYHVTGGSDEGMQIWDDWSTKSPKYRPDEIAGIWDSFERDDDGPVAGLGTIFHIAKRHGWTWEDPITCEPGYADVLEQQARREGKTPNKQPADEPHETPPLDADDNSRTPPPEPPQPAPVRAEWIAPNEDAVALAFAENHNGRIVYDHTEECWFHWTGSQWLRDHRNSVFNCARELSRAVRMQLNKAPPPLAKAAFTGAVERFCRSDPRLAVDFSVWDRDPDLIGTPGGVVDLRTGELLTPRPDRYISRYTSVAPAEPGTPTPVWDAFLDQATKGDKEFQAFIYRACGYMLTGDVSEEVLFFFHGPGGNGKGTLLTVITGILGDYHVSVPIEVFTAGSYINLEYYRAQMANARLVTASETEQQAFWSETLIKDLTGNDTKLSGRSPYGKPFDFKPVAKLLIIGNYAPRLKGRSPSMERRLRVAPFTNVPEKPDPTLKDRLRAEYPAILRRFIDGCIEWRRQRLGMPTVVRQATKRYFEQQDSFGRWRKERCDLDPHFSTKPIVLFTDFHKWARENGEDEISGNVFAELIEHTDGLRKVVIHGTRMVKGIALKPPPNRRRDLGDYGEQGDETE
jgi:putative DNA primase/helicase